MRSTPGITRRKIAPAKSWPWRPSAATTLRKSAEVLIAEVAEAATVDAVQEISDTEKAGKNRKTVLDACEKKIAELKAQ